MVALQSISATVLDAACAEQLNAVDGNSLRTRVGDPTVLRGHPPRITKRFYSRNDGIVDWRTCIDRQSTQVIHQRSNGTHVGMGIDPDVWRWTAVR